RTPSHRSAPSTRGLSALSATPFSRSDPQQQPSYATSWLPTIEHPAGERNPNVACSCTSAGLPGKMLEPVSDLRASLSFIRELRHEQCERLHVPRHLQRSRINRVETDAADERRRYCLGAVVVPAVHEAG